MTDQLAEFGIDEARAMRAAAYAQQKQESSKILAFTWRKKIAEPKSPAIPLDRLAAD
jgi:hypothetical protein